jgi:hypothetical protein
MLHSANVLFRRSSLPAKTTCQYEPIRINPLSRIFLSIGQMISLGSTSSAIVFSVIPGTTLLILAKIRIPLDADDMLQKYLNRSRGQVLL